MTVNHQVLGSTPSTGAKVKNIYTDQIEPDDVYIGRAGKGKDGYFGNPFYLYTEALREVTLQKYRDYFYKRIEDDLEFHRRIEELRGKNLVCFCAPKQCHGDIILEWLNNHTGG